MKFKEPAKLTESSQPCLAVYHVEPAQLQNWTERYFSMWDTDQTVDLTYILCIYLIYHDKHFVQKKPKKKTKKNYSLENYNKVDLIEKHFMTVRKKRI